MLAPDLTVIKTEEHTSLLEEPLNKQVNIRHSDFAEFGTKDERKRTKDDASYSSSTLSND